MQNLSNSSRQKAFDHALAQQRLEGLSVPPETIDDLRHVAHGDITINDAIRLALSRYSHVEIRE